MKKILAFAAVVLLIAGSAFAKPVKKASKKGSSYSGDVQAHVGVAFTGAVMEVSKIKSELNSIAFEMDVQSWHLFDITSDFSVGFMVGLDGAIGGTTNAKTAGITVDSKYRSASYHFNFLVGPAVSYQLGDVVRFNGTMGFSWMLDDSYWLTYEDLNINSGTHFHGAGLGFDIQAKFMPTKIISPVVGTRLTLNWTDRVTIETKEKKGTDTKVNSKVDKAHSIPFTIYLGAAYNF